MDLNQFIRDVRGDPGSVGFFIDLDGTLAPIVDDPDAARPVASAAAVLSDLARRYRIVALISGRRADFLQQVIASPGVRLMGLYGSEVSMDGEISYPPESDLLSSLASRLARDAEAFITTTGLTGCEVEYKHLTVSVHYRRARDPEAARDAIAQWAAGAAPRRKFISKQGRMVVELLPASISKAQSVERVVKTSDIRWLVYAGDDTADVEAMMTARRHLGANAMTIGVVSNEEPPGMRDVAEVLVDSPEEVVELLKRFA